MTDYPVPPKIEMSWDDRTASFVIRRTENWVVAVAPMLFNHRITISGHDEWGSFYTAGWCYPDRYSAIAAAMAYDPETERSPMGYVKVACDARVRLWQCACGKVDYEEVEHDCPLAS